MKWISSITGLILTVFASMGMAVTWNSPHSGGHQQNVRYAFIVGQPKSLDPARAYSSDEYQIIAQIYEPPLQYHYLRRPYELVPLTAATLPTVTYYDAQWKKLPSNVELQQVAYSVYDIYIKPGICYQPHPAFVKNKQGHYLYLHLKRSYINEINSIYDFPKTQTKELIAHDYAYQIKRLASPKTNSPIFGLMTKYILGFSEYGKQLEIVLKKQGEHNFLDLRKYSLTGVKVLGRYHYQIILKGVYPQFKYWLAMTFFSPVPWQVDAFYSQPGMKEKNITLDWYPIGTGPYMVEENNPNKQIVLVKNPNFHIELYPRDGERTDRDKGYLTDAGKPLPFITKIIFVLDKESIPRWNKFMQGYYDKSSVGAESFDQAIKIDKHGKPYLTAQMQKLGIRLKTTVSPGIFYIGFNMLDPVVGGYTEKKRKLRQAIAIALDYEEFIAIFHNGRGIPAHSPIPPGIFGYVAGARGINPYVYTWFQGKPKRRSLTYAKKLLAQAGYPGAIDPKTGKPLILNYDVATTGNPDDKARLNWIRKQFEKLGIKLNIRATLYNRFRDKVRSGNAQIFSWGWLADYPDPENFLFLLYGPNGKVKYGGENASNYYNSKVNKLFQEIRNMLDGPERQKKIDELLKIVRKDSPWVWGFHPIDFTLSHQWNRVSKPHGIANNTLKYERIDVKKRAVLREKWNQPIFWPLLGVLAFIIILVVPLGVTYWRSQHRPSVKRKKH